MCKMTSQLAALIQMLAPVCVSTSWHHCRVWLQVKGGTLLTTASDAVSCLQESLFVAMEAQKSTLKTYNAAKLKRFHNRVWSQFLFNCYTTVCLKKLIDAGLSALWNDVSIACFRFMRLCRSFISSPLRSEVAASCSLRVRLNRRRQSSVEPLQSQQLWTLDWYMRPIQYWLPVQSFYGSVVYHPKRFGYSRIPARPRGYTIT